MDDSTKEWAENWRQAFARSEVLRRFDFKFHFTGSRVLSPSDVTDQSDLDIAMWVHADNLTDTMVALEKEFFLKLESSEHYRGLAEGGFVSLRGGMDNVVLTTNAGFYRKHQLATELGKNLGLKDKEARVRWFRKVLYGESMVPTPEPMCQELVVEEPLSKTPFFDSLASIDYAQLEARVVMQGKRVDWTWPDVSELERAYDYSVEHRSGRETLKKAPVDWRQEQARKHKGRPR